MDQHGANFLKEHIMSRASKASKVRWGGVGWGALRDAHGAAS